MKYTALIFFFITLLFASCNNEGASTAAKADSASTVAPDTVSTNKIDNAALVEMKKISDSFNTSIIKMNELIKTLAAEAKTATAAQSAVILKTRDSIIDIRDNTAQMRNNVTTDAIKNQILKLSPIVNSLKSHVLKLQKLGESVERIVSIFTFLDKALGAAISGGVIPTPVVIPVPAAS